MAAPGPGRNTSQWYEQPPSGIEDILAESKLKISPANPDRTTSEDETEGVSDASEPDNQSVSSQSRRPKPRLHRIQTTNLDFKKKDMSTGVRGVEDAHTEKNDGASEANKSRPPARPTLNIARLRSSYSGPSKNNIGDLAAFSAEVERAPSPATRRAMLQKRPPLSSNPSSERVPNAARKAGNPALWDHDAMTRDTFGNY